MDPLQSVYLVQLQIDGCLFSPTRPLDFEKTTTTIKSFASSASQGRVKWGASACLHLEWVSTSVLVQHLLPSNNCVTNLCDRNSNNSIYLNEPVSQHSLLTTRWVCCLGHVPNVSRLYCMPLQGIRQVQSQSDTIG